MPTAVEQLFGPRRRTVFFAGIFVFVWFCRGRKGVSVGGFETFEESAGEMRRSSCRRGW